MTRAVTHQRRRDDRPAVDRSLRGSLEVRNGQASEGAVVALREISPGEVEVDGESFYIDSLVESVFLYIGRGGRWWSTYLGTVQRDSFAAIDTTFRLTRFELVRGMLRIDARSRMVDYDACASSWQAEDVTRVCGMDGDRAVCWAEIATLRDSGWAGGRVVFYGTPEELAECEMPVGLLTASDRARLERPMPPVRARFRVAVDARGRLRVRGPVPEAFTGPIEVRDVPALVGGFE
jgi:hypothetical protein